MPTDIEKYRFAKDAVNTGLSVTGTMIVIVLGAITVPEKLTLSPLAMTFIIVGGVLLLSSILFGSFALGYLIRLAGKGASKNEKRAIILTNLQLGTFFFGLGFLVAALVVRLWG